MKKVSTNFLRSIVVLIGAAVLGVCIFALPTVIYAELRGDFDYLPLLVGLYVPLVPFLVALRAALRLLSNIDKNEGFSQSSVEAFQRIKRSAFIISVVFACGMPYIFYLADMDDAPGLVALGLVIIGASVVIGTFAGIMQKMFQNAVDIKHENDLTV